MTTTEFDQTVKDWIADGEESEDWADLHRDGLSADARTARLPARERLQDLHRLRQGHRVHVTLIAYRFAIGSEVPKAALPYTTFLFLVLQIIWQHPLQD